MTIDSPTQIREYIHEYLGTGPSVDEFASGFLRHKEFDAGKVLVNKKPVVGATTTTSAPATAVAAASTGAFGALGAPAEEKKARRRRGKK